MDLKAADGAVMWVQEVTVQFNLCNEPWLKYSMLLVADQGLKPPQWTSARLHKESLFLETARCYACDPWDLSMPQMSEHFPVEAAHTHNCACLMERTD